MHKLSIAFPVLDISLKGSDKRCNFFFLVRILSLSVMFPRFIHVAAFVKAVFLFMAE